MLTACQYTLVIASLKRKLGHKLQAELPTPSFFTFLEGIRFTIGDHELELLLFVT